MSFLWAFLDFVSFSSSESAKPQCLGLAWPSAASSSDPDSFVDPAQVGSYTSSRNSVWESEIPLEINNKLHSLDCFPVGLWHLAETQASRHQQFAFQRHLRNVSWRFKQVFCGAAWEHPLHSELVLLLPDLGLVFCVLVIGPFEESSLRLALQVSMTVGVSLSQLVK